MRWVHKVAAASTAVGLWVGVAGYANASTVTATFDFNNIGNNANTNTIQTYMAGMLSSAAGYSKSVGANPIASVSGAIGEQGANSYAGEGYVVGPRSSGGTVYPITLGDSEHATSTTTFSSPYPTLSGSTDGFLKNCTAVDPGLSGGTGCSASSSDIFLNFSNLRYQGHAVEIASISFDFEIFPDGTCPADTYSNCGGAKDANGHRPNLPDLEVWTGDNGTGTNLATYWGADPGSSSVTYTHSVNSGSGTETAPQLLGTGSFAFNANTHVTTVDFMDWPETIGIDNLAITFRTVPEPAMIGFFALAIAGIGGAWTIRNRRKTEAAPA